MKYDNVGVRALQHVVQVDPRSTSPVEAGNTSQKLGRFPQAYIAAGCRKSYGSDLIENNGLKAVDYHE